MNDAPRLRIVEVECFERDVRLRLPFRFGVITVTHATQAVIRATIALRTGAASSGVAAETLAAKWFDKSPRFQRCAKPRPAAPVPGARHRALSREGLEHAVRPLRRHLWRAARARRGARARPLVASYGPALLDRAILDALGRSVGLSFAEMISRNVPASAPPT